MKKTLLLSVVASTMIMAGGDIAPVEPVVAEAPAIVSGWDFNGQAVVYYQTIDAYGAGDLFDQATSDADAGLQLKAVNKDMFAGIGAGVTVNGLATLNLENSIVSNVLQTSNGGITGGWIGEGYLTYSAANTMLKGGRQTLPQSLSPFAYSENWNVFENTYDAALIVNTDVSDTVIAGAWVYANNTNGYNRFNDFAHSKLLGTAIAKHSVADTALGAIGGSYADMASFESSNGDNGIFMISAQNKSIANLTLTGSYYYGDDFLGLGDGLNIWWLDGKYNMGTVEIALQGGQVVDDALQDTTAFGAKVSGAFAGINAYVAYSSVDDGTTGIFNVGGQQTSLYTQMIINEGAIASDNDTVVIGANTALLGGTFGVGYGMTTTDKNLDGFGDSNELDVYYTADLFEGGNVLVGYVNMDSDHTPDANNVVRVVGRYNF